MLDSARSDASVGTGPKLKRMQQRTAQLRKLFSLPASEARRKAACLHAAGACCLLLRGRGAAAVIRRAPARRPLPCRLLCPTCCSQGLLNDYACALKKRMLLQGRMYVFSAHLCFYSSLFGYVKVKVSRRSRRRL